MQATEDKNNAIAQAEKTATKAKLADRLINGLSGENKRWNETIAKFGVAEGTPSPLSMHCCANMQFVTCLLYPGLCVMCKVWQPDAAVFAVDVGEDLVMQQFLYV